jgi:hypothetical protein
LRKPDALHCRILTLTDAMKKALLLFSTLLFSGLFTGSATADTLYKCTDKASDTTLYTNQRVSGRQCTIVSSIKSSPSGLAPKSSATSTPGDFPRVSSNTQKERDGGRRTILEQELASEQRNLDEAKKANNINKAQLHERNIAALQKEIANLK